MKDRKNGIKGNPWAKRNPKAQSPAMEAFTFRPVSVQSVRV